MDVKCFPHGCDEPRQQIITVSSSAFFVFLSMLHYMPACCHKTCPTHMLRSSAAPLASCRNCLYPAHRHLSIDNVKQKPIIEAENVTLLKSARRDAEMAENEYLDSSKGLRWRSVVQAIQDGCSIGEFTERVEECLFKTLRQIRKDLPFAKMVRAMDNPDELSRVCQSVYGGMDVKHFIEQAALEGASRPEQLKHFLDNTLGNCLYDIPYMAATCDGSINMTQVRAMSNEVRSNLSEELQRVADKLAENPDWVPRRTRRGQPALSKDDRTKKMLNESLLAGFRK